MTEYPPATLERIDAALAAVAEHIEAGGEVYWPIFERLERERNNITSRPDRLARARGRVLRAQPQRAKRVQMTVSS